MKIGVPEKYPHECAPDSLEIPDGRPMGVTFIKPIKQTFKWLTMAVLLAAHNASLGF